MLDLKVPFLGDGLVLNTGGYTRAKNILTSRYGKVSEVVNAHVQAIITLPIVHDSNPIRIHEFYKKLLMHVQSLETIRKLKAIKRYLRNTLDKLPEIRSGLVRLDGE